MERETAVRDVPFLENDMKEHLPTMGKPLDTADEPGKADAELGEQGDRQPGYRGRSEPPVVPAGDRVVK